MIRLPRWFRRRPEIRQGYTDQMVTAIWASASTASSSGRTLAAVEIAARLWGSALASATVSPAEIELAAISPSVLDTIGRALCRYGESLHVIDVRNGQVVLTPCGQFTVQGSDDPASWRYLCTLNGPSTARTVTLPASSCLHVKYSPNPSRPWTGRSPLSLASETAEAGGLMEQTIRQELAMTVQQMLAPKRNPNDFGNDLSPESLDKIVSAVAKSVNQATFALPVDAAVQRLGPSPPPVLPELRAVIERSILAAFGISPLLVAENPTGTGLRESFRQFLHSTIKPLGSIICDELRVKLHPDCELTFGELKAGDVQAAARAFGSLVTSGVTPK